MNETNSLTTIQGTAMPEATLCNLHLEDEVAHAQAVIAASAAGDYAGDGVWYDSTSNDSVVCIACNPLPATATVLVHGNLLEGLEFIGPFSDFDDAVIYASEATEICMDTFVATLRKPGTAF